MKDLIFEIFNSIATTAMEKEQSVTLRYENSQRDSSTIISKSKVDEDALTLSVYPITRDEADEEAPEADPDDEEDEEE